MRKLVLLLALLLLMAAFSHPVTKGEILPKDIPEGDIAAHKKIRCPERDILPRENPCAYWCERLHCKLVETQCVPNPYAFGPLCVKFREGSEECDGREEFFRVRVLDFDRMWECDSSSE